MRDFRISKLNDIYCGMLTERQSEIIKLYYDYDLSYSEISEIIGISRQAVWQIVVNTKKQLEKYDDAMGFFEVLEELDSLRNEVDDANLKNRIETVISLLIDNDKQKPSFETENEIARG